MLPCRCLSVSIGVAARWCSHLNLAARVTWVTEVEFDYSGIDAELDMVGHVFALVPCQRLPQMHRQALHRLGEGVTNSFGVLPFGSAKSITQRVWRSTNVPMAVWRFPMRRSPSQWPDAARSSPTAGLSLIDHHRINDLVLTDGVAFLSSVVDRPVQYADSAPVRGVGYRGLG